MRYCEEHMLMQLKKIGSNNKYICTIKSTAYEMLTKEFIVHLCLMVLPINAEEAGQILGLLNDDLKNRIHAGAFQNYRKSVN